jgi:hypothetical protein
LRNFHEPNQNSFCWYKFLVSRRKDNNQLSTITHFLNCSLLQESLSFESSHLFCTGKLDVF